MSVSIILPWHSSDIIPCTFSKFTFSVIFEHEINWQLQLLRTIHNIPANVLSIAIDTIDLCRYSEAFCKFCTFSIMDHFRRYIPTISLQLTQQ
jgi:hypothetical protein